MISSFEYSSGFNPKCFFMYFINGISNKVEEIPNIKLVIAVELNFNKYEHKSDTIAYVINSKQAFAEYIFSLKSLFEKLLRYCLINVQKRSFI